jgi:hypothetical protein
MASLPSGVCASGMRCLLRLTSNFPLNYADRLGRPSIAGREQTPSPRPNSVKWTAAMARGNPTCIVAAATYLNR